MFRIIIFGVITKNKIRFCKSVSLYVSVCCNLSYIFFSYCSVCLKCGKYIAYEILHLNFNTKMCFSGVI